MRIFRDNYTLRKQRDWYEDRCFFYMRWKHWTKVKIRRCMINNHLYRRRCSECCILIKSYGYEGVYDMCRDCYHEAHPY